MYVLIGEGYDVSQTFIGGPFEEVDFEERVALFTHKADAKAFAEKFRLQTPQPTSFAAPQVFKRNSRMSRFTSYRIEQYVEEQLDINPTS